MQTDTDRDRQVIQNDTTLTNGHESHHKLKTEPDVKQETKAEKEITQTDIEPNQIPNRTQNTEPETNGTNAESEGKKRNLEEKMATTEEADENGPKLPRLVDVD